MKKLLFILPLLFIFSSANEIAFVKKVKGYVTATENEVVTIVKQSDWLNEKMLISTAEESGITMIFKDNSVLVLGSNSILRLDRYVFETSKQRYKFELSLDKGSVSFESGKIGELSPENFIFKTPEATVGIRGTKFMIKVQ